MVNSHYIEVNRAASWLLYLLKKDIHPVAVAQSLARRLPFG